MDLLLALIKNSLPKNEINLRSEAPFKLHEGTKVQVLDIVDDWKKIKLTDGKIGWMPKKELKEI